MSSAATPPPLPPTTSGGGAKAAKAGVLACGCVALLVILGLAGWLAYPHVQRFFQPDEGGPPEVVELPLLIDAAPWGEVTLILDGEGNARKLPTEPITPVTIKLPPGSYTVELRHPLSGEVGRCEVRLVENEATICHVQLLTATAEEYFAEVGWGKGGTR